MAQKRLKISDRLVMTSTLLCFCAFVFLSGLSLFFIQSPHDKATDLIAMAAHYEAQLSRNDLSSDAVSFMRLEQQKFLTQAWQTAPFHEKLQGLYGAQDVAQSLLTERIANNINDQLK